MGCCGKVKGAIKLARAELGVRVTKDVSLVQMRRKACESCDRWEHGRCLECSCYTWAKSVIPSEKCPLGKWPDDHGVPNTSGVQ